jgi:hypothetical protein
MNKEVCIGVKGLLCLHLLFLSLIVSAQSFKESDVILFNSAYQTVRYHVYEPPLKIQALYSDTTQAVNQFPEQVLMSMISARNQDWVNYNYLNKQGDEKPASHFRQVERMNKENNYFEAISKYEFTYSGNPAVFIKYYLRFEEQEKPMGAFKVMQKINGKWYIAPIPNFINVPYMLYWFKEERMQELLSGAQTGNQLTDQLIAATRDPNGSLDFEKLSEEFRKMYLGGTNSERFNSFIDPVAFVYLNR